jgi:uncharacterized protein (TIGR03083 family)
MGEIQVTTTELLSRMQKGWEDIQAYLKTLTPAQMTDSTDAAGWTVKDHVIHLATWEDGVYALLQKQPRYEQMGLDKATWEGHDTDAINAVIQKQHKDMPLDEVLKTFEDVHKRLVEKIQSMSNKDLLRPYSTYQADSTAEKPVFGWIVGNTYEHYAEHKPWIAAIVGE